LLGYGLAGRVFHAPLIAATPGLTLAAVVTRDPERRAALHAAHPGAIALATPEQLWAHASHLDLVVVATPNRSHAPLARAALDAGLPTVVDKPLAPTAAAARALVQHARTIRRPLT
jgi:predicted dehydrogenase